MNVRLGDHKLLEHTCASVANVVDHGNVHFDAEHGMSMSVMDSSHIALVRLRIPVSEFVSFTCPRPLTVGLSFGTLRRVLHWASKDTTVHLVMARPDDDRLHVEFLEGDPPSVKQRYDVMLLQIEQEDLSVDGGVDFSAMVEMTSYAFDQLVKQLCAFGDNVRISGDADRRVVILSTGNDETPRMERELAEADVLHMAVQENFTAEYALKLLRVFSKTSSVSSEVLLRMKKDYPLNLCFSFGADGGMLEFYLAPRACDDD